MVENEVQTNYEKYQAQFGARLAKLRINKGVSARDMSLSLGQNPGYINSIENNKSLPSMRGFFCICDYLDIEPKDFFFQDSSNPQRLNNMVEYLVQLDDSKLGHLEAVIEDLVKIKKS